MSTKVLATVQDEVLRTLSYNGQVSVLVATGTQLVNEVDPGFHIVFTLPPFVFYRGFCISFYNSAYFFKLKACDRHKTAPTAGAALGRGLMGTLLMACFREQGEKTQVTFKGDGPLGGMQIIAEANGIVKGKVGNPACDPPLRADGKLNVGAAMGRGILAVVRSLPFVEKGWQAPYTGMVPISTGEVAEDMARYLLESEQTQSALGLGVSIGKDLRVRAAGGFLISVLPFAEEETIVQLEQNIASLGSVTSVLEQGANAKEITDKLLHGLGCGDEGFSLKPEYGPCDSDSLKNRMRSAVATLGEDAVRSILNEQGSVEVTCEFCKETFQFEEEEVMEAVKNSKSP